MGHTVPHYWARDECNYINTPVEVMKEFASKLGDHGVPELAHWNNGYGKITHNNVMREIDKGTLGNPGKWNLDAQNHYVTLYNDLNSIKNTTTNPILLTVLKNMLEKLEVL